jgi:hypothetical protein
MTAGYTPSLDHGEWFWQARALDPAGNASAWTEARSFTYTPGRVGRRSDLPIEVGSSAPDTPFVAVHSVGCPTKGGLRVVVVLAADAEVSLELVQRRTVRGSRWQRVKARRFAVAAGVRTVELQTSRPLRRDRRYQLRVEVDAEDGETRSATVRAGGSAVSDLVRTVCTVTP